LEIFWHCIPDTSCVRSSSNNDCQCVEQQLNSCGIGCCSSQASSNGCGQLSSICNNKFFQVAACADLPFPNTNGTPVGITLLNSGTQFKLTKIGTYEVSVETTIYGQGRFQFKLAGNLQPYAIFGGSNPNSFNEISFTTLITTTNANTILEIVNIENHSVTIMGSEQQTGHITIQGLS